MPNDNEKLARFEKAIFTEVDEKAAAILNEVQENRKEALRQAEEEAKAEAEKQSKQELEEIEAQYARAVTKEKLAAKQRVLLKRKELIEGLFEEARQRLLEFSQSEAYEKYLSSLLYKSGPSHAGAGCPADASKGEASSAKIMAREEDCPLLQRLAPECQVEPDPTNLLGGVIIVNSAENIYIDETFAAKLEAQKERFYSDSSIQLDVL